MILFCMAEKKYYYLLIMLNSAKDNVFVVYTHPHKTQIDVSRQVTMGGHSSSTTSNIQRATWQKLSAFIVFGFPKHTINHTQEEVHIRSWSHPIQDKPCLAPKCAHFVFPLSRAVKGIELS